MIWILVPQQGQNSLVGHNEFPEWLERNCFGQIFTKQNVSLNLSSEPLLRIAANYAIGIESPDLPSRCAREIILIIVEAHNCDIIDFAARVGLVEIPLDCQHVGITFIVIFHGEQYDFLGIRLSRE